MKTIRLRIAVLGCIAPSLFAMHTLNRADDSPEGGPVWGRVTYNGRPVKGGAIRFFPIELGSNSSAIGAIGEDGRYAINSDWRREHTSPRARFQISIIPFPSNSRLEDLSPRETPGSNTGTTSPPGETAAACPRTIGNSPIPERFSKLWTSELVVTLDHDSARVDVDLKD